MLPAGSGEGSPAMSGPQKLSLALVLLGGLCGAPSVHGQAPASSSPTVNADLPDPLPGLPHPPNAPASLFAPPTGVPSIAIETQPYFQFDPLLDLPGLPQPGWFAGAEVGLFGTHLTNQLAEQVTVPGPAPNTVALPSAPLNWTVAPRFEVGRRLSSGFGEISLSYRFL